MLKSNEIRIVLCLVMAMLLSFSAVVFAEDAEAGLLEWITKGWSKIHNEEEWTPEKNMSRIEFVALINSLFEFEDEGDNIFEDINETDVYYKEILKAVKAGIIEGRGNGKFDPLSEITKAEAYTMLSRALKLEEVKELKLIQNFNDYEEIPKWAAAYVEALAQKGMLVDKNKVKCNEKVTGEEAVSLIETAHGLLKAEVQNSTANNEKKGGGNNPLNYIAAYVAKIENNVSINIATIEEEVELEDEMYIKLEFDRGIVRENWENNRAQIKLMDKDDKEVEAKVQRIADVDSEKSFIFIKPLNKLEKDTSYKIFIGKDLKANNGKTLGKDVVVKFRVK